MTARRGRKQVADLLVGGLGEVLVPEAHGVERLRGGGADYLAGEGLEFHARFGRGNRHRHDYAIRPAQPDCLHGGLHGGTGRQPVVYQDDGALAALELGPLRPCPERSRR